MMGKSSFQQERGRIVSIILALLSISQMVFSDAFSPNELSFHRSAIAPRSNPFEGNKVLRENRNMNPGYSFSQKQSLSMRGGSQLGTQKFVLSMINPASASLIAGSIAGAIGVGVAFPLDTLKTKSQVMGKDGEDSANLGMGELIALIYKNEGIAGFFGGVKGMMVGQALIKSMAFSANSSALSFLNQHQSPFFTPVNVLIIAACFSGFITSFLVAPIERIKVMIQASGTSLYENEFDAIKAVLKKEGIGGLLGRGLGPTIAREVPSYAIYFVVYGLLIQTPVAQFFGGAAPLIFGALSGCACWLPVYPIDVVKTLVQNTEGGEEATVMDVSMNLYKEGGIGAFFDGLTPKMLRAAVNHSVTFWVYDLVIKAITGAN